MPTNYKNIFATNDMIVHYRLRKDGVYEARCYRQEIDRSMVQNFLFTYVEKGVVRTAHKLMLMLKCIFDMIADDYGIPTPMRKVVVLYRL